MIDKDLFIRSCCCIYWITHFEKIDTSLLSVCAVYEDAAS